jgi:hypothetical protein
MLAGAAAAARGRAREEAPADRKRRKTPRVVARCQSRAPAAFRRRAAQHKCERVADHQVRSPQRGRQVLIGSAQMRQDQVFGKVLGPLRRCMRRRITSVSSPSSARSGRTAWNPIPSASTLLRYSSLVAMTGNGVGLSARARPRCRDAGRRASRRWRGRFWPYQETAESVSASCVVHWTMRQVPKTHVAAEPLGRGKSRFPSQCFLRKAVVRTIPATK